MMDLSIRGLVTLAFKNLGLIIGLGVLSISAALIYFFLATNIYQARASVVVRFGSDIRPELQIDERQVLVPSSKDERRELIESYMRILQSRDYSERLVKEFGVETLYPSLIANPPPYGTVEDAAAERLRDSIVAKSGQQTNVMEITVFHPKKELALQMLKRLIEMYISTQADLYENPQLAFTKAQMTTALQTLEQQQNALNDKRQKSGIFEYGQQFELLLSQQNTAVDNITKLNSRVAEAEGKQQRLEAILGTVPDNVASIVDAAKYKELQELSNELVRLRGIETPAARAALADKSRLYQQRLREVQSLNRGGSSDIYQSLLADYLRSSADADAARRAMDYWTGERRALASRIETMQRDNQAIIDLNREVELSDATYRALARKHNDAAVNQKLNDEGITRITVIDAPFADPKPARPRKFLTLAAALVGWLLSSIALIVLKESLSDRIFAPWQIEQALRLKVISSFGRGRLKPIAA